MALTTLQVCCESSIFKKLLRNVRNIIQNHNIGVVHRPLRHTVSQTMRLRYLILFPCGPQNYLHPQLSGREHEFEHSENGKNTACFLQGCGL